MRSLAAQDLAAELEGPVNPRSDLSCPSPALYSPTRPNPPGTPTLVGVGVWFEDISGLSDVDQTVATDVHVLLRWKDHRLADPDRGEGSADCPLPVGGLWMPAVAPENLRTREHFYDARFLVDSQGIVTFSRRSLVETANPLDFHDFPFDRHRWKFTIWPTVSMAGELAFHPLAVGRNDTLSIQGWDVGQPEAETSIVSRPPRVGKYSRFDVFLVLARDWRFYIWKLGLPLTLIVLMAYGVYWVPSSAGPQRIALGMTSMLTLIAYMFALGNGLPKISYLTRADRIFIGSAVLVFLGLATALLNLRLEGSNKGDLARKVNRFGRVIYPLGIAANVAGAFLW